MGRGWYRSVWLRIAGAAIGLLLLAGLAAPFLIPADQYRPLLVWAIESGTGRRVAIDGLTFYLLPTVRIHVVNFRVENPDGFPAGDALLARSIDLGLSARALLSRRLDVTYVAPDGVEVNVLRNAAGRTNFAVPSPPHGAPQRQDVFTLERIGTVTINDAAITFANVRSRSLPAPSISLTGVSGTIGSIDPQGPDWLRRLHVVANLGNARLTSSLLTLPVDFHSGTLTFENGTGRGVFAASAGQATLSGTASFARLDPLSIAFSVEAPELDLGTLASLVRPGASAGSSAKHDLVASGSIAAARVVYGAFEATHLNGRVDVYTNGIALQSCTFSAYGGSVRGSATVDAASGVPVSARASVRGLNVSSTLSAIGFAPGAVTGTLDADFALTTLLERSPERSLKATGTFTARNGSFPGHDFSGSLVTLARIANLNLPSGDTRFSSFGGDLRIADERGYSRHLKLVGNGMEATSAGSFGFNQTLNYTGTGVLETVGKSATATNSPVLAAMQQIVKSAVQNAIGETSVTVPFAIRGTFESPQFSLAGTPHMSAAGLQTTQARHITAPAAVQAVLRLIPGLPSIGR